MSCLGLGLLVASDMITDKNYPALNKGLGDAFMIIGSTFYGICEYNYNTPMHLLRWIYLANATEEFFVRKRPLYEVGFLFYY